MRLPNGWRLKRGAYYWRPYIDGKRRDLYLGTTLAGAHRRFAQLLQEHEAQSELATIGDLLRRFLALASPQRTQATQTMHASAVAKLMPVFGAMRIEDLKPHHAHTYYARRSAKVAAKHEIGVLRAAYSEAVKWGAIHANPLLGQVTLRGASSPRRRYVTDAEIEAFLGHCAPWLRAYVRLKLLLGLPKQDMLSLTRDDVREDGLHARRRKTEAHPKVYAWDDAGELERALDAVSAAHKGRVGSRYLFHTHAGAALYALDDAGHRAKQPTGFDSMWQRAMAKYVAAGGARFTEHDLRAKAASDTTLEHAQALMDHETSRMTVRVYRRAPKRVAIGRKREV